MKIYRDITEIPANSDAVVTIGTFDGVHIGHKDILKNLVNKAYEINGNSFVITFEPHPRTVLGNNHKINLISTFEEKIEEFEKIGIDNVLAVNFTKEFSQIEYDSFIKEYIVDGIGAENVVIGYDHKFGKNRSGDEKKLRELGERYGFEVSVIPEFTINGSTVSSTLIRKSLLEGKVKTAAEFLGRFFSFSGKVVEGAKRGRIMGFPTANIAISSKDKLVPMKGVYAVECIVGGKREFGMMNIGQRPTFEEGENIVIEVNIFDFHENIYGKEIKVSLIERVRDEQKFGSMEELIYQINRDKKNTIQIISKLVN